MIAFAEEGREGGDNLWPEWWPREMVEIKLYGTEGNLRWFVKSNKNFHFERKLDAGDVSQIRTFLTTNQVDHLPAYLTRPVVDGISYDYFHFTPRSGCRIWIKNPPISGDKGDKKQFPPGNPAWRYSRLVDFSTSSRNLTG